MRSLFNESIGSKVVLLGNSGAGKTSILQCQLRRPVSSANQPTIGCQFHEIPIQVDNETVSLKVWDTAGQEVYRSIVPVYVRDAAAAILVYDVTDPTSFASLDHWRSLLLEEQSDDVLIFVVCNKIDLIDSFQVDEKVALQFADKIHAEFFKVSAIEGRGINDLFVTIARAINGKIDNYHTRKLPKQNEESNSCC